MKQNKREEFSVFESFAALDAEWTTLDAALGGVLAQDIYSPENLPPFSRAAKDGYALRSIDTLGCSPENPALLQVTGEALMAHPPSPFLPQPGEALRIATGVALPLGADAVLMQEDAQRLSRSSIAVSRSVHPGEHIIAAGSDYAAGAMLLSRGSILRPQEIGLLAALGFNEVRLYRRPKVAILSTGNELVACSEQPRFGQIRDINSALLAALVREAGAIPFSLGACDDHFDFLLAACAEAMVKADVLLLSGGSALGRRDFTLRVFSALPEVRIIAPGVRSQAGKRSIFAVRGNKALFGLPGNPGAAMLVFYLFVRPLLQRYRGRAAHSGLRRLPVRLAAPVYSLLGREEWIPVRLIHQEQRQEPLAMPIPGGLHLLYPWVQADGLLLIGSDSMGWAAGMLVEMVLFPLSG